MTHACGTSTVAALDTCRGINHCLTILKSSGKGTVTFGDESQLRVTGKDTVEIPRFPPLQGVLYVEGISANLLSISQFCDEDLVVQFSKECNIFTSKGELVTGGQRTIDNCYVVKPSPSIDVIEQGWMK